MFKTLVSSRLPLGPQYPLLTVLYHSEPIVAVQVSRYLGKVGAEARSLRAYLTKVITYSTKFTSSCTIRGSVS